MQDIEAHLKGGIPKPDIDGLAAYWQVFPNVRRELFADADRPGYSQPKVEASQVKATIFSHPEFTAFNSQVTQLFGAWKVANTPLLTGIQQGDRPKMLIETLSESLLETFRADVGIASLIDPYGVYQHLMDYLWPPSGLYFVPAPAPHIHAGFRCLAGLLPHNDAQLPSRRAWARRALTIHQRPQAAFLRSTLISISSNGAISFPLSRSSSPSPSSALTSVWTFL